MKNPALKIGKIAALILSFIIFAGISAYLTLTLLIKSEDIVIVPDLIGKEVVYVLEILTDLGLNTKVKGFEYSEDIPKNHIIFQQPESSVEIKKGRDIKIVISKGVKNILMPNLQGLSLQQARIIIEENGLCYGEQAVTYSSIFEKDNIIAQVKTEILKQLPSGKVTDASVADAIHIAQRSLQRKLQKESTTFRAIFNDLRKELAKKYLQNSSMNLIDIAFNLGFGEYSSFSRAFKQWTGITPSAYRA